MSRICRLSPVYNVYTSRQAFIHPTSTIPHRWYTTRNTLDSSSDLDSSSTSNNQILTPLAIDSHKYPSRGGQNLSLRFRRLERSLRGKGAYKQEISELQDAEGAIVDNTTDGAQQALKGRKNKPQMFLGFVIPDEPKPPADDECCMSGCAICVYDLYNEALEDYNKAVHSLRTSLRTLAIPETEWPAKIRTSQGETKREVKKDTALSAFEEFERQLKMKQERKEQQVAVEGMPG
ncbi:hypothetical protein QCA50_018264 [Cerrena zonata]|uniref:Oxidoreductase-like domain-containing protein n=1 Tax=Cerrena zonata TaxID=2478898 RepID=A0AAW0FER0_9APHY